MANELRVRSGFLGGLIEDNPLSGVATTLTSAALASMPAIGATQHMALVLDPDGFAGAPEIVYVTAHTAAATTATILRAQEGTTARAHDRDMVWVHSVTVRDFPLTRRTRIRGTGNKTTTSASFAAIDSTNLPYLYVAAHVGDLVTMQMTCQFAPATGHYAEFDFEVDRPTSADGRVNADAGNGIGLNNNDGIRRIAVIATSFLVAEVGLHGFRPVWKSRTAGQTTTLYNGTADPDDSVVEVIVANLGPETG